MVVTDQELWVAMQTEVFARQFMSIMKNEVHEQQAKQLWVAMQTERFAKLLVHQVKKEVHKQMSHEKQDPKKEIRTGVKKSSLRKLLSEVQLQQQQLSERFMTWTSTESSGGDAS